MENVYGEETKMSRCWCGCVLAVLVIVFAWLPVSWAKIVLTVLGALLAIKELAGICCCAAKSEPAKSEGPSPAGQ